MDVSLLKGIALFEGLEESDLKKIASIIKERDVPKGTMLFQEGDPGDAFYLLKKGGVELLKKEGGKEKVVNSIEDSDKSNFFGEMALVEGVPRTASIRTSKDSSLMVISKTDFDMMLRLNSFIALRIMGALSKRVRAGVSERTAEAKAGKVACVFSPKSGAGKSVFAANVATGLAKLAGAKVLLVDLDLQFGDQAFQLDLKPKRTIADLVESPTDKFDVLREYLVEHKTGFSVLPAPIKPEQSEMINSTHLRQILDLTRKYFDYIILDTHSLFQDLTINAMDIADFIMLLMLPNMNHIKAMHMCLKVMENLKYPPEKTKIILNREGCQFSRTREEIEGALKRKVDFRLADDWANVSKLGDSQQTIFEVESDSSYRDALTGILEAVTGKSLQAKKGKTIMGAIKGWFG